MQAKLDSEIWSQFKNGDEKSFSYIFDVYHLQLFEYGVRFTSDEHMVRDCIQDLFFELALRKEKLSDTDNILFYLLKSLRQKIIKALNEQKGKTSEADELLIEKFHLSYSLEADRLEKELKLDRLAELVNQLPSRQKETIYLRFYKSLSNKEIAEIMDISYQSVGNSIQKAIKRLKSLFEVETDSIILFFQNCVC